MKHHILIQVAAILMVFHQTNGSFGSNLKEEVVDRLMKRWLNKMDGEFTFKCPAGEVFSAATSIHDNWYEDRQWDFKCKALPGVTLKDCKMPHLKNNANSIRPMNQWEDSYTCANNGLFAGVWSKHFNLNTEDRAYDFWCCTPIGVTLTDCKVTGWLNEYDNILKYNVPEGHAIRGVRSKYLWKYGDRRFKFDVCKIVLN